MRLVENIDDLYNFIATVVLCAPNDFPYREWLADEDQLNLDRAFEEMRHSMTWMDEQVATPEKLPRMKELLEQSYQTYKKGDQYNGAHLLQDWEDMIFKRDD